jgi:signal transduction histidine kinase
MAGTTTQLSPEAPRAAEPVLGRALRPGIVLLDAPDGAGQPWADGRALALLGCRDGAELAARWPAIRQRLLAGGLRLADPAALLPGDFELPPDLTGGRPVRVSAVAMDRAAGGDGDGRPAAPAAPAALLLEDAELAAALESDLRAAAQMQSLAQIAPAVAHDLRAPINAMVLNLEVLKETLSAPPGTGPGNPAQPAGPAHPAPSPYPGAPPHRPPWTATAGRDPRERQQRYVTVLREELARLHQSLELFLAHVSPRGERTEALDGRGPAQDLADLLRPPARKQQAQIELLLPDVAVPILAQRYLLRQALLHFGLAALERVPRDGTLAIRLERLPARARLRITAGTQPDAPPESAAAAPATGAPPRAPAAPRPPAASAAPSPSAPGWPRFSAAGTEARQQVAHGIVASFGGASRLDESDGELTIAIEFPLADSN